MRNVFFVLMAAAVLPLLADPKTVYVDCKLDDYTGHDGSSWEQAVKTLKDGVAKCASGDTLKVASGVYDEGKSAFNSDWGYARLEVVNKQLHIIGVDGPENTIIQGEKRQLVDNGDGTITTNYVRCVNLYSTSNTGSVIEGFTLRGGDSGCDPNRNHNFAGGAVCSDVNRQVYFYNCVITGCYGYQQVVRNAWFVKCRFIANVNEDCSTSPQLGYCCSYYNCLFYGNSCPRNGDMLTGSGAIVGCTMINNRFATTYNSSPTVYNCVVARSGTANVTATKAGCSTVEADYAVMGTANGDYRIRRGSPAETVGDAQYLGDSYFAFPETGWIAAAERYSDIDGNAIPSSGTICAGCSQTTALQKTRLIRFSQSTYPINVDGAAADTVMENGNWVMFDSYPTQIVLKVRTPADMRPIHINFSNAPEANFNGIFPEKNDDFIFNPMPDTTTEVRNELTGFFFGRVVWTDPEFGSYTAADGSEEHPYETIQDAIDGTSEHIVIQAKKGIYDKGGVNGANQQGKLSNYRVWVSSRRVRVVGMEGAEKTILKGAVDPVSGGLGDGAMKLIGTNGSGFQIQDFTLTGGYSKPSSATSYEKLGSAITSMDTSIELCDCIITNNHAASYAISHYAALRRCRIFGNSSQNDTLCNVTTLNSCAVGLNTVGSSVYVGGNNKVINCTFFGDGVKVPIGSSVPVFNTVIVNVPGAYDYSMTCGCLVWNAPEVTGTGFTVGDPRIMDGVACDMRLFKGSAALTAGALFQNDTTGYGGWYARTDIAGNRLDLTKSTLPAGAYSSASFTEGVYVGSANGLSGVAAGINPVKDSDYVIGPAAWSRPVAGIIVDGVTNKFEDLPGHVYTLTPAQQATAPGISPIYTSDWYVSPSGTADALGYFPASAKSLDAALTNPNLVSGDRVLACRGTYNTTLMEQPNFGTRSVRSRAVLPNGVSLESVEGPEVTIIEGKAADVEDPLYYDGMTSMHGIGSGAVRCVYVVVDSKVKGFTLRNGHTRANKDSDYFGNVHGDADFNGGGVYCVNGVVPGRCVVENCIFDGCAAFRGGGSQNLTSINCEYKNCFAIYGGGGMGNGRAIGCLTHGNECYSSNCRAGFFFGNLVVGCTIDDGLGDFNGVANMNITNTLVTGIFYPNISGVDLSGIRHSYFNGAKSTAIGNSSWATLDSTCRRENDLSTLQLDSDYRPVIGGNVAIDQGTSELAEGWLGETDLKGGQRVYNNAVDVGALEADWRATYAKDIKKYNVTVESATSGVAETAAGTVSLNGDSALSATWSQRPGKKSVTVRVTGNGTLSIKLNGETVQEVTAGADTTYTFSNALAQNRLDFVYAPGENDSGHAEILEAKPVNGFVLSYR